MGKNHCSKIFKITGFVVALMLASSGSARSAGGDFGVWVQELRKEALSKDSPTQSHQECAQDSRDRRSLRISWTIFRACLGV